MKKLVSLFLLVLAACATAPLPAHRDDSNTANQIPTSNALMVPQMQTFMGAEAANRNQEQRLANFVDNFSPNSIAGACLGPTGAGLTMTLGACIAYNAGYRSTCGVGNNLGLGPGGTLPTSTTADCPGGNSITFANNATTWVAMDENTTGNNLGLANFTRVTGTHYLTDAIDTSQPAMAPDSQLLMKVTTAGGSITAVQDLRNFSPLTTLSGAGFFTHTQYNYGLLESLSGMDVPYWNNIFSNGAGATDGIASGITVPATSLGTPTGVRADALAGYVDDLDVGGAFGGSDGVALLGFAMADATNAYVWGINTGVSYKVGATGLVGTGAELDFGQNNSTDVQSGINVFGDTTTIPAAGTGYALDSGTAPSWTLGINLADGAIASGGIGIYIGTPARSATQPSLPLLFGFRNGSNVQLANEIYAGATGDLISNLGNATGSSFDFDANATVIARIGPTGMMVGAPTGSFKGAGTANAAAGYYNNGESAVEFPITVSGELGKLASTITTDLPQACTIATNAGHITNLLLATDLNGGSCSTAPTYNVVDVTNSSALGTAQTAGTSTGVVWQSETLAFSAGDEVCVARTINGGTCSTPFFSVTAQLSEP